MPVKITCRKCYTRLKGPESKAGQSIKCPTCGEPIAVPALSAAPTPAEPRADSPDFAEAQPAEGATVPRPRREKSNLPLVYVLIGSGTLLVLLLISLGVVLAARSTPTSKPPVAARPPVHQDEEPQPQQPRRVFAFDQEPVPPAKPTMEIVFIFDEGSGLAEAAPQVKQNWLRIARSIAEQGFDCRFAVLPCHAKSEQIPNVGLTPDLAQVEAALTKTVPAGAELADSFPKTDCLKVLEEVLTLEFRNGSAPVVFLMTNTRIEDQPRFARIAERYRERGIKTFIQADESQQEQFQSLVQNGGQFCTLEGRNLTEASATRGGDNASAAVETILSRINKETPPAEMPRIETLFFGVKVKGRIALVCDISPSMGRDFPPLIAELRKKFPKDTPLILIGHCIFMPPNTRGPSGRPVKFAEGPRRGPVYGVDFTTDPHAYTCNSTTDAILFAVEELKRDTVMFNNDMQDGGSLKALAAFEDLWKRQRFTLSGRSLNCDAPDELKAFVKKTGGDFKVDPISRQVAPARRWQP